jgi:ABC-2 type transport system ATP-binding protein
MDEAERCDRLAFILGGKLVALGSPAALKKEQMRAGLLSLHTPQAIGSMELVQKIPGVEEITLHGSALHITTNEDQEIVRKRIADLLHREGIPVESLGPTAPSLEDVFLSLVEQTRNGP